MQFSIMATGGYFLSFTQTGMQNKIMRCYLLMKAVPLNYQHYSSQLEKKLQEMKRLKRGRLKVVSDKVKTRYDIRSNSLGSQERDQVWLYNPNCRRCRPKYFKI